MNPTQGFLIAVLGQRLGQAAPDFDSAAWTDILDLARRNRVAALIHDSLPAGPVPPAFQQELLKLSQRSFVETTLSAQALGQCIPALAGIPWLLLRGPALGARLYGDLLLRPYGDLDLLVHPADVTRALATLGAAGFGQPRDALPLFYYRRYHLHIELSRPGATTPARLELHWALDHPFTLLTPDVAGLLARGRPQRIGQFEAAIPEPDDLVLSLAIHFVKHAVLLPLWLETGEVHRIVEEGHLLSAFDLALAFQALRAELNWETIAQRAAAWGAAGLMRDCLEAVAALWPEAGLAGERDRFRRAALGGGQRRLYAWASAREEALRLRRGMFFRPIRLLDSLAYLAPPDSYLQRRYGRTGWRTRARHWLSGLVRLGSGALTLAYCMLARCWKRAG